MEENRKSYIDTISGVLIIYMIFTHIMQWAGLCNDFIYIFLQKIFFFFMAWFAFKAGSFFKQKSITDIVISSFKSLVVPFIIYSFLGWILWCIDHLVQGDINGRSFFRIPIFEFIYWGSISGNLPLWWLPSLFVSRIIFNNLVKLERNVALFCVFLFAFMPLSIMYLIKYCPTHLYFGNIMLIVLFMSSGYYMRDVETRKIVICIAGILYLLGIFFFPAYVDFRSCCLFHCNFFWWLVVSLSGILVFNALFKWISFKMPILIHIGRYSLYYYCIHWLIIYSCHLILYCF